jgi:hypothetical protein
MRAALALVLELAGCKFWHRAPTKISVFDFAAGRPRFQFLAGAELPGVHVDYLTIRDENKQEDICFVLISDPTIREIAEWQYGRPIGQSKMEGCVPPLAPGRYEIRVKANGRHVREKFEVRGEL